MPSLVIWPDVALALIVLVWTAIVYQIEIHNVDPCLTLSYLALVDVPAVITGMDQPVQVQRLCIKELAVDVAHTPVDGSDFSTRTTGAAMYGSTTLAVYVATHPPSWPLITDQLRSTIESTWDLEFMCPHPSPSS
jgi:hypothetical protein